MHEIAFLSVGMLLVSCSAAPLNPLTPEEERVIIHKGTEPPFTGMYVDHNEPGVYHCKRCSAPLYRSESKFHSGCGWPSFDDEIAGAVKRVPDADGSRTEIVCARCDAHLGHVFLGEQFTPKNTRHCVNSISMTFSPLRAQAVGQEPARAIFGGGCFWGVEYFFQKAPGVLSTRVGYIGGRTDNPTYQEVCNGNTGHVEALEVVFDPKATTYENLARLFFEIHDPTEINKQGPDFGEQYRSAIFYLNDEQRDTSLRLIEALRTKGYAVATTVEKAATFWPAEDYHQQYYSKKNGIPYCHRHTKRF